MRNMFRQLAAYNAWANARLYEGALALPDELYRANVGVFFQSLHGTLNHILLTDRLWLTRLTCVGEQPKRLDGILYDDRLELARARLAEDSRLLAVVSGYDEATLARPHAYQTTSGKPQEQPLSDILMHLFNHQTHHRGQAHACLSIVTKQEPPPLDLLLFQRGVPPPDLAEQLGGSAAARP
ncbi:Uncharacterized damage-inducible protein DinB (forms a four-helix bundle) [Bradyrhizobium sp. Gha]|nr:DinB family protein [Bradyrhizobium sp. Gha]SFJ30705.1 Uncharacterized damage-inducible protein DinB (forms a four-helix bundle) [Bradyrhizobium sp. Gha]